MDDIQEIKEIGLDVTRISTSVFENNRGVLVCNFQTENKPKSEQDIVDEILNSDTLFLFESPDDIIYLVDILFELRKKMFQVYSENPNRRNFPTFIKIKNIPFKLDSVYDSTAFYESIHLDKNCLIRIIFDKKLKVSDNYNDEYKEFFKRKVEQSDFLEYVNYEKEN